MGDMTKGPFLLLVVNPRRACARVIVVVLSVCVSCLSVC